MIRTKKTNIQKEKKKRNVGVYMMPKYNGCQYVKTSNLTDLLNHNYEMISDCISWFNEDRNICFSFGPHLRKFYNFQNSKMSLQLLLILFKKTSTYIKRTLPKNINLVAHPGYFKMLNSDIILDTAIYYDQVIEFSIKGVISKKFESMENHLGPTPKPMTHYAALMLHEFGHVIYQALMKLNRVEREYEIMSLIGSNRSLLKCWKEMYKVSPRTRSEWFADIFMRECIHVIFPNTYKRPL